ncbi:MAG: CDP-diacylglycerol--serine O-phosphatidyltransferase [Candidatus Kapaibacteriales bacterium]
MRFRTRSIIPNLLTLANLFSGIASILAAAEGEFMKAGLFILSGAFFDAIDGIAARITNAASDFGVELDSLCDAVTFGVAPSILMYYAFYKDFGNFGLVLSSLQALLGVLRLARFNVELTSLEDKEYFKGLPIPGAALFIGAFVMTYFTGADDIDFEFISRNKESVLVALSIAVPLLMVSNIKFENLPRPTPKGIKTHPILFSFFILGLILLFVFGVEIVFPLFGAFVIFGTIRQFIFWISSKSDPEEEVDMSQEAIDSNKAPFEF